MGVYREVKGNWQTTFLQRGPTLALALAKCYLLLRIADLLEASAQATYLDLDCLASKTCISQFMLS